MATNPMQRKARMSFILGMVVMLLITGIVIVLLFMQLKKMEKEKAASIAATKEIYVLKEDVASGQVITTNMYEKLQIDSNLVPANAIADLSIISNYSLQDKEGNEILTKGGKLTINDQELKQDAKTGNYYVENGTEREYIDINTVPLVAKVAMRAKTVITKDLLAKGEDALADDVRREEYNSFVLPMDLTTGEYIDIRLMLPSGQNFIVVSKKEVTVPNISGVDSATTIWLNVSESEILTISSAIVDAYRISGAKLYVDRYTEAGMQKAATPTYVVSAETYELLKRDPNILEKAKTELMNRTGANAELRNNYINEAIQQEEQAEENYKSKMEKSITDSQTERKQYLDSLSGAVK